jgi:hypothetical protein
LLGHRIGIWRSTVLQETDSDRSSVIHRQTNMRGSKIWRDFEGFKLPPEKAAS